MPLKAPKSRVCWTQGNSQGHDLLDRDQTVKGPTDGAKVGAAVQYHLSHLDFHRAAGGQRMVHPSVGQFPFADLPPNLDGGAPHSMDLCSAHSWSLVVLRAFPIRA